MSQQPAGQSCANCYFGVPDAQGISCRVDAPLDPYSGLQTPLPRLYVPGDYWCGKYSTTAVPGREGHAAPGAIQRAGGAPSGQNCALCYFGIQDNQGIACRVNAPAPSAQGNQINAQRRYVSPDFWCGLFSTTPSSGENPPGVTSFNARTGDVALLASDVTGVGGLANPNVSLTGVPLAPTAVAGTSSQQIATCAFVANAVAASTAGVSSFNGRTGNVTLQTSDVTAVGGLTQNQTITLSGDMTGAGATSIAATVTGLQGRALAATAPTTNQVLQWSGTQWAPATAAAGGVTSVTAGAGLSGGTITTTGTISLTSPVAIALGGTGATTAPAALANLGGISGNQTITISGDASGSGATAIALTLATVNANVGTWNNLTVNAKGLVTAGSNVAYLTAPVANASLATMATLTLKGNNTAGTAVPSDLTTAQVQTMLGYITGNQTITLSGNVTGSGTTAITTTIGAGVVTNAMHATMPANTIKGNNTASAAAPADLTTAQMQTLLGYITGNQTITLSGDISGSGSTSIATTLPIVNSNVGTFQGITVNAKGLVTAATNQNYLTGNQSITISGDASGSGTTAIALTLATVNSNVGTWNNLTVNGKGLVTAGSNVAYLTANQTVTLSGDVTGAGATTIAATVARLQGQPVSATAPTSNQVLQWSGTQWTPTTIATGGVTSITAGTGLTGGTITTTGTIALSSPVSVANGGTGASTAPAALTNLGAQPIAGVTNGSDALAGQLGEYATASAAPATVTAGSWVSVASLALSAGDWDVTAVAQMTSSPPGMGGVSAGLSGASSGTPGLGTYSTIGMGATTLWQHFNWGAALWTTTAMTLANVNLPVNSVRVSSAAATTVYLLVNINVSSGITASAGGALYARRAR